MRTTEIGKRGEDIVCRWLCAAGYHIVARNFWIWGGELDIIAENEAFLAFVEVKTRKPDSIVQGIETITYGKKQRLIKTASIWCAEHPVYQNLQKRFDVACVTLYQGRFLEMDYYENAFELTDTNYIL